MTPRVAIIGAGMAGLTAARRLAGVAATTVFEKSRGFGGRIATRYADPWRFDHGAQFFTVRDPRFSAMIEPLLDTGRIATWHARFVEFAGAAITARRQWDDAYPHYVGAPAMNAIGEALADGLDVRRETTVEHVSPVPEGWLLTANGEVAEPFDWLIVTAPASQTRRLLPSAFAELLPTASMRGCYSLMLGFDQALPLDWDAALVKDADISWISVNSSKPGRGPAPALLVHATNRWADEHIEDDPAQVKATLLTETCRVTDADLRPAHAALHRWRFANIDRQHGATHAIFPDQRLGVCGDWFIRGRIEAASLSAMDLTDAMLAGGGLG